MNKRKEEIKRIIETNDTVALRAKLKKQMMTASALFLFFSFTTVLGILNPENWKWYHWLFPVFAVMLLVTVICNLYIYIKLRNTNEK